MYLKSISLKGFKSFPDRTRLDFGSGVSVIVGPNGSGKSNITDAILWALGEQSPLSVRGQSMQDVIFAGGHGVQARSSAEVELVLDNSDQTVGMPLTEISIMRRLDRSGDGEYRINGARCRLTDVLEVMSDTGLGKEMHSVISQGRVESLVTSKPRDRRMLIEEAAGLGKHRKRRRQAQLKLERTEANLARALDVEQEARSRLRPLKRQAEAAELHARLDRQTDEARWTLSREQVRTAEADLAQAQAKTDAARAAYAQAEGELAQVAERRAAAERALTERSSEREQLANRFYSTKSAYDRIVSRLEGARRAQQSLQERAQRRRDLIDALTREGTQEQDDAGSVERIKALEQELAQLDRDRKEQLERELADLEERRVAAEANATALKQVADERGKARQEAEANTSAARQAIREAEIETQKTRREAARVGAELAAINQMLRAHAGAPGGAVALADCLRAEPGYELALSAVLGPLLRAAVTTSLGEAEKLLSNAGTDGGTALVVPAHPAAASAGSSSHQKLLEFVRPENDGPGWKLAESLLSSVYVVDSFTDLDGSFAGVAVTKEGRVWLAHTHELRHVPAGGEDRVLAERNRRDELIKESERAAQAERASIEALELVSEKITLLDGLRDEAENAERLAIRQWKEAAEVERHVVWLAQQRRSAPDEGSTAQRKTQLTAALAAEQRLVARAQREREERQERIQREQARLAHDVAAGPAVGRLAESLEQATTAVKAYFETVEAKLKADSAVGDRLAGELRAHAGQENQVQAKLKAHSEEVTRTEVQAQQLRDRRAEAARALGELAEKLGLEAAAAEEPLPEEERVGLEQRIERLRRRREQLGPVNPLAQQEYTEALAHVEELETQRTDLDDALRELRGLIRDTDKRISEAFEETFSAAQKNFEELAPQLFPGGRGRLKLVSDKPDVDGEEADKEDLGIEIEITPKGKSAKSLTLLSGGEKAMTALAFLFAVFIARPCPFYVLDEVEAALDDLNLDRFLTLLRQYSGKAQFIVVTHQKRTMEVGDSLYGVSMAGNGVSKVISRKLPPQKAPASLEDEIKASRVQGAEDESSDPPETKLGEIEATRA